MENLDQNLQADEIEALRKALEAETERGFDLQRQLDRANAECEEFVSTAAHNLREPLRDIASYSQLAAGTHAGSPTPDSAAFLDRIREGAARMESLLADVVDYWDMGPGDPRSSRTDMEAVLRQALLLANPRIVSRNALVTHDPLPRVCGDFELLTKVLRHLIRNAIEYGPESPSVHISCRREDPVWVFSVRDNGAGIDAAFRERVFGMFKRLHGKDFPGSGLGLAFCRKTIERHGGRIWVESTPGTGSTFFFTLRPAE